jgi:uncharacterized protein (DUF362 family)
LSELLTACGINDVPETPEITSTLPPTETAYPTQTPQPATPTPVEPTQVPPSHTTTPTLPAPTATPWSSPDLVVVRNGEPEDLVRNALAAMGGMEKFVPKGANVIIKPNVCVHYRSYEYAATTNPWVVGALVKLCFEAGASKVRVMDHTYQGYMWEGYAKSGIRQEVEAAGGEMEAMPLNKFIPTEIPLGVDLKTIDLYEDILNAEVLINVPIAKHHADAKLTLGMKNLMGVMNHRLIMHTNMAQRLADLSSRIRPTLNVMDAVRMLMDWGPTGGGLGDVKKIDTVIVSQDIVALDSYTATLFDKKPTDLDYVNTATAMGLGRSDLENLRIEEIGLS